MTATVVPFQKRKTAIDLRRELQLDLLDVLVLQEEIGGKPIPLCKLLDDPTQSLCGETLIRDTLGDLSVAGLMRCEYGRVTITELGCEHFYAHSPREKIIRREIIRVLNEAPGGTHIRALHKRQIVRDACLHESQIDEVVYDLIEKGIADWPSYISNIRLTGKGLAA